MLEYDRAGLKVCHHNGGKATFPPWEQEHKTGLIYSQSQIREETDTDTNTSLYLWNTELISNPREGGSYKWKYFPLQNDGADIQSQLIRENTYTTTFLLGHKIQVICNTAIISCMNTKKKDANTNDFLQNRKHVIKTKANMKRNKDCSWMCFMEIGCTREKCS